MTKISNTGANGDGSHSNHHKWPHLFLTSLRVSQGFVITRVETPLRDRRAEAQLGWNLSLPLRPVIRDPYSTLGPDRSSEPLPSCCLPVALITLLINAFFKRTLRVSPSVPNLRPFGWECLNKKVYFYDEIPTAQTQGLCVAKSTTGLEGLNCSFRVHPPLFCLFLYLWLPLRSPPKITIHTERCCLSLSLPLPVAKIHQRDGIPDRILFIPTARSP